MNREEREIAYALAEFLSLKYPSVIFRFDVGADIRLTIGQARVVKEKLRHQRGYPDLFIAHPSKGYHGMFLEIKKDRGEVFRKDGKPRANKHIREQILTLDKLFNLGYYARFGFGLDECIKAIEEYLGA